MANLCKRILKKEFKNKNSKEAYLEACKWLANNVVSNDFVSSRTTYSIQKTRNEETGLYVYVLELFVKVDEKEIMNKHCAICKETHSSFFINEETNCNWCKIAAFDRRLESELSKFGSLVKDSMKGSGLNV